MRAGAACANLAWFVLCAAGHRRFVSSLDRLRETQESILRRYLRCNAETAFGREHGFSRIRSVEDYRSAVPLSTWDDYARPVGKIAGGEPRVLTRDPVLRLEPTSGSTRAVKWIPRTASLRAEVRRAVDPWVFDLFSQDPSLMKGPAYWSISPALRTSAREGSRIPSGLDEDSAYLGRAVKWHVDRVLAVPGAVSRIADLDLWRRLTLIFLLKARDLRLISIWHPTFLSLLISPLEEIFRDLVTDIGSGVRITHPPIEVPADRRRARELSRLASPVPSRIWPDLRLISCWGDAHAAMHLAGLQRLFPGVRIQPKGLMATEGIVSLPFRGLRPLAATSHFFEFLSGDGAALAAWEVRPGRVYSVVITTGGGLYRYRLQDRVEVTGFLGQVPCLRFLGKEDQISDLFGEKLSEGFVAESIRSALRRSGLGARFAMLAPETSAGVPRYVLYLEVEEGGAGPAPTRQEGGPGRSGREGPAEVGGALGAALEAALEENPHYEYCVRVGQLAPAEVHVVETGASQRHALRLHALGERLGVVKPSALSTLTGWAAYLGSAGPPSR